MNNITQSTNSINDLLDISDTLPLTENDQPMVSEIFEVLKKYNAEKRFGLSLLHKHFDINEDEVLVESVDTLNKIQTVQPAKRSELGELDYTETLWRLDKGIAMTACVCIRFGNDHSHQSRG